METNQAPTGKISIGPLSASGDSREVLKLGSAVVVLGLVFYGCKEAISVCGYWVKNQLSRRSAKIDPTPVPAPPTSGSCNETPRVEPKTLNDVISGAEDVQPLVGSYLCKEDVMGIVAETNQGKSILATQIAVELASGTPSAILPEDEKTVVKPQTVFLYDSEQTDSDMKQRYGQHGFSFPDSLFRISNCAFLNEEQLLNDVEKRVMGCTDDVLVVIDNKTSIIPALASEAMRSFILRLKSIQSLVKQTGHSATVIIVAHTSKRNGSKTKIGVDDIAGSANFGNLVSSIISLERSDVDDERRIRVVKSRKQKKNPKTIRVKQVEEPYLHFELIGQDLPSGQQVAKPSKGQPSIKYKDRPIEDLQKVVDFYKKGVDGHGLMAVVKEFGEEYGLNYSEDVKRFFAYYNKKKQEQ